MSALGRAPVGPGSRPFLKGFSHTPAERQHYPPAVPRKVRQLLSDLRSAGFKALPGGGKGGHRKLVHPRYPGAVTVSGASGADAKPYQERQVRRAIEQVKP